MLFRRIFVINYYPTLYLFGQKNFLNTKSVAMKHEMIINKGERKKCLLIIMKRRTDFPSKVLWNFKCIPSVLIFFFPFWHCMRLWINFHQHLMQITDYKQNGTTHVQCFSKCNSLRFFEWMKMRPKLNYITKIVFEYVLVVVVNGNIIIKVYSSYNHYKLQLITIKAVWPKMLKSNFQSS